MEVGSRRRRRTTHYHAVFLREQENDKRTADGVFPVGILFALCAHFGEKETVSQWMFGYRKLPKEQSERVGKVIRKIDPGLALLFYAKANCPKALFNVSFGLIMFL